jgi:capsid protein
MNFLDQAIAAVAPGWGVNRAAARRVLDELRSYDGAMLGRRGGNWNPTNASANAAIKGSLARLRARAREVSRNTWWGNRIKSVFVAHSVGTGITPICKASPAAAKLWKEWGKRCDAEGQLNIDGLIALAVGTIYESGEVLPRIVPVTRPDLVVPIELQLLEPDHLDGTRDGIATDAITDQGIIYNAKGKRSGYWLLPNHPGATGLLGARQASVKVGAGEILHVYRKERIGQGRGVPWVAPVLSEGPRRRRSGGSDRRQGAGRGVPGVLIKSNNAARTLARLKAKPSADGDAPPRNAVARR